MAVAGPADPDTAWERYANPALWPTWSPQIRAVRTASPRLATGMTGAVLGWGGLELPFVVDAVDEAARTWVWRVRPVRALRVPLPGAVGSMGALRLRHAVGPADGGGALTTLEVTGAAPVVLAYAPAARWALRRLVS